MRVDVGDVLVHIIADNNFSLCPNNDVRDDDAKPHEDIDDGGGSLKKKAWLCSRIPMVTPATVKKRLVITAFMLCCQMRRTSVISSAFDDGIKCMIWCGMVPHTYHIQE